MRFEVSHLTRYTYERPVLLEPLIVRLRPRSDIFQRLVSFDLSVDPQPEGMSEMVDAEGNALSQVWFVGVASMLALRTTFAVDTLQTNPFDYIVLDPDSLRVPMSYDEADRRDSHPRAASTMAVKSATSREAPPTSAPSTSGRASSSAALSGLTEPP